MFCNLHNKFVNKACDYKTKSIYIYSYFLSIDTLQFYIVITISKTIRENMII